MVTGQNKLSVNEYVFEVAGESYLCSFLNDFLMITRILDVVLIVLLVQLVTLLPFLFFSGSGRVRSNRLLGIFLLAKALCITNFISFRMWDFTYNYFPHAFYFGTSFAILWGRRCCFM